MGIQFTLAARYLAGRKLRTFLTTLAIVFGVTVIFGLNGLLPTLTKAFTKTLVAAAGEVDLSVTSASGGTFSPSIADKVRATDGVDAATPVLRRQLTFPLEKYDISGVAVLGVEPSSAEDVRSLPVAEGRFLDDTDEDAIVMSRDTAKALGVSVGDTFEAPAATGVERLKVVGLLSTPALPGSDEVFVPLATAQSMFGDGDRINEVEATYAQGEDRGKVRAALKRRLGSDHSIGGVQTNTTLFASLRTSQIMLNMFGLFALAIGGFIIFNTFRTAVVERRHDIGMLRSLGASRSTIVGLFVTESLLQGVMGTVLGLVGGYALAVAGLRFMVDLTSQYFTIKVGAPVFTVRTWVAAIGLGLGITFVAGIWPAIAASRVTPLEAMRPALGEVYEKATKRRAIFGVSLIVMSLVALFSRDALFAMAGAFVMLAGLVLVAPALVKPVSETFGGVITLVFAREGRIAGSNLTRQPNRAAITASAVMISLAIIVALLGVISSIFGAFTAYLDRSLGSDLLVLPQSIVLSQGNVAAGPKLARSLEDVPGIERVASLRLAFAKKGETQVQVAGIDPDTYPKIASLDFSKGSDAAFDKLKQGRNIILNGVFAAQSGGKVGQTVRLQTPNGAKDYKVVAIGSDYINAKLNTVYVSQDMLKRDFNTTTDILLLADAKRGADLDAVKRDAEKVVAEYPAMKLYESSAFRESQLKVFDQTLVVFYVLLALLAIPSMLGLLNTLAINVIARTREIGMLRAVGSTRGQVRRMVLVESLLLSGMGTALGILAGVFLGYGLTGGMNLAGFRTPYQFPYLGILTAVAVGLLFGVIASLIPARHAARLDVVKALRYE